MKDSQTVRKNVFIAILIALGVVFSYFDGIISRTVLSTLPTLSVFIPNFKFGFANIIILLFVYNYSWKEGFEAVILKTVIVGLFLGQTGMITFLFSFSGSVLSFVVMKLLKCAFPSTKSMIPVSTVGGFTHSMGQLIASAFVYGLGVIVDAPIILIFGLITGTIVGILTQKINASVIQHLHID